MGLIAQYPLNGNANDVVGNNDGNATDVSWVQGKIGQAGDFNGNSSLIQFDKYTLFDFSVSFWLYPDSDGDFSNVGQMILSENGVKSAFLRLRNSDDFELATENDGEKRATWSNTGISTDSYNYITITRKGTVTTLYIDGVSQGDNSTSNPLTITTIGTGWDTSSYQVKGDIDDFRIYDHALSQREVRDLSLGLFSHIPLASSVADTSNHIQLTPEDQTFSGTSLLLDGTGGLTATNVGFSANKATISIWAKLTTSTGKNYAWDTTSPRNAYFKWSDGDPTRIIIGITDQTMNVEIGDRTDEWVHFCITSDGSTDKAYVDGIQEASTPSGSSIGFDELYIGMYNNGGYNMPGELKDFRIYTEALTQDQVTELYQQRASIDNEGSVHTPLLLQDIKQDTFDTTGSHQWEVPDGVYSVDVFVVAGGGGGGYRHGGGGGAGGLIYETEYAVTPGATIPVSVGAGGAGSTSKSGQAKNGGDSSFDTVIATGGGGGGQYDSSRQGLDGGSGGGSATSHNALGTVGQGHQGGSGYTSGSPYNWGGGGGAAEPGHDGTADSNGSGGAGKYMGDLVGSDLGDSGYFAGGGGAGGHQPSAVNRGLGGVGGGGDGGAPDMSSQPGEDAMPGTGGGGGAASTTSGGSGHGGNGGHGIVVVRY